VLISVTCKSCHFSFKVHARFAGKVGACPNPECRQRYFVRAQITKSVSKHARPASQKAMAHRPASTSIIRRHWYLAATGTVAAITLLAITVAGVPGTANESGKADGNHVNASLTSDTEASDASKKVKKEKKAIQKRDKTYLTHVEPFLRKYCIECHGRELQMAGIDLHKFRDQATALKNRKTWGKVIRMLNVGIMPPADHELRPTETEKSRVIRWIDSTYFNIDCNIAYDPGRVTIRRLNRAEYNNTIRDLVGVDFRPAEDFPSDDVGSGFDNIGDVLSLPVLLMEKYIRAAEKITKAAIVVGDPSKRTAQRYEGNMLKNTSGRGPDSTGFHPLYSVGAVFGEFRFLDEGEYILRAEAKADQAGPDPARMEIRVAGRKVIVHDVKGRRKPAIYETRFKIGKGQKFSKGTARIAAAFINDYYRPKVKNPKLRGDRNLYIRFIELQRPKNARYPDTHMRILFVRPGPKKSVQQSAREILQRFAARAYRRPVDPAEIEGLVKLVELAMKQGDGFERGIQLAVQAILVSPHFLFRVESDREPNNSNRPHRLSGHELAARLSYFLWSSMPDDKLFTLAKRGVLHEPDVLERQARRMLQDAKSSALIENFAGQWLNLRNLDEATPDPKLFQEFDKQLRSDMRHETELLFEAVMRKDRSILDFLDADFTFLNERLAKHYEISDVQGKQFRKVALTGDRRAGLLTHASILTLTSDPTKTSPVKRGKWILENILGTPPPPPLPNVPEFAKTKESNPNASLREQLELHRTNPICVSCHKLMDPLGLGFENFDPIGRWRFQDGERTIDPSGKLPSGESFKGPLELVRILKNRKSEFSRHLTQKLLTYALGRGLEHYDKCAVDQITAALAKTEYRFSTLVIEIVKSEPFLKRRGDGKPK